MKPENMENEICMEGTGILPDCACLAFPFVPVQGKYNKRYSQTEALNNGTLFPGLNLPFHLKVNASNVVKTPLNELQALEFVILELALYLDTHPNDEEAFKVYQSFVELEKSARQKFVDENHPITHADTAQNSSYTWVNDPWPWNMPKERSE